MARFTLRQAPAFLRAVEGDAREAALRGLYSAALRLKQHVLGVIAAEDRPPVDEGNYRASWAVRRTPTGAILFNTAPQAPLIEEGVRASAVKVGRKMIDALTAWVLRKRLESDSGKARQRAWAIARAMEKRGIFDGGRGLRILEKASRMIPEFMNEEVGRELAKLPK